MTAPNTQQVREHLQRGTYLDPNVHHTVLKTPHSLEIYDMQLESIREEINRIYGDRALPSSCEYVTRLYGLHIVKRYGASTLVDRSSAFVEFYPPGAPELADDDLPGTLGKAVIYRFPSSGGDAEKEAQHCAAMLASMIDQEDNKTPETAEEDTPPKATLVDWCHLL